MLSYDETGGWGDHVVPYTSPNGTEGEWIIDPYDTDFGLVPMGPGTNSSGKSLYFKCTDIVLGFRLPFYIVSPFTRGGNVFTEHADHNSQIMFIEKWLASKGFNVETEQMPAWRRQHMSDLTKAFDFENVSHYGHYVCSYRSEGIIS
jgi:phospholipase C